MKQLDIHVWSDIACPWCYVGKRRLEAALAGFPHREAVRLTWRSFELDPGAPAVKESVAPYARRLADKYGTTVERADEMIRSMTQTAAADGLDFRFDVIRPGNTFDAHRLVHLAGERDAATADAMKERLFRAYLTEGKALGDREVLVELAVDVGLDAESARAMLGSDAHAEDVRDDEREAHALGVRGVPFFVIGRHGVSGAQSAPLLREVLDKAWAEIP